MMRMKDILTLLLLIGFAAYATWQKLQILALATILCAIGIMYQKPVRRLVEILLKLVKDIKQAKVANFEVVTERKHMDLSDLLAAGPGWRNVILRQLDSTHIALLIQIYKAGAVSPNRAMHDVVRELRSLALLQHDGSTLATATEVKLTVLGEDLALSILTPPAPSAPPSISNIVGAARDVVETHPSTDDSTSVESFRDAPRDEAQ